METKEGLDSMDLSGLSEEAKILLKSVFLLSENFTKKIVVLTIDKNGKNEIAEEIRKSGIFSEYVVIEGIGRSFLFLPKEEAGFFPHQTIVSLSLIWSANDAKTAILVL